VSAANLTDVVLSGSTVQIGTSALQADFPAPGGVVAFGLRRPGDTKQGFVVSTGLRNYSSPLLQANGWRSSQDGSLSIVWGIDLSPSVTYGDGTSGHDYSIGAVPRWTRSNLTLTAIPNAETRSSDGADYGFISTAGSLPPNLAGPKAYSPPWARHDVKSYNAGLAADIAAGPWKFRASSYLSKMIEATDDFTLLRTEATLIAHATTSKSRDQWARSISNEIGASRELAIGSSLLRLYGAARYRRSDSLSNPGETFDLGFINLHSPHYPADPPPSRTAPYAKTLINHASVGAGFDFRAGNVLEARAGVQRIWYDKAVVSGGNRNKATSGPWLYDAALTMPVSDGWLAYASYTRGLEEKGTAPNNAVNRNEVLPSVVGTQIEAGVRGRLAEALTFIATLFQISKPTTGFDPSGRFGLIGNIRHRGAEFSLSGRLTGALSLTAGFVAFEPRITTELGAQRPVASVGVQPVTATISANYDFKRIAGLSLDGRFAFNGRRPATASKAFYAPARATIDVGTRYRTQIGGVPTAFRARVQNLTNVAAWLAQSSGQLRLQSARAFSLSAGYSLPSS
jgi:iron complex outermembrane receptor protein